MVGGLHRAPQDQLARPVVKHELEGVGAFRGRVLRMGVVDIKARTVGEHGVYEMGLDLRRHRALAGKAACVPAR